MNLTVGSVYSFKLNSGEELIAKVKDASDSGFIIVSEPVSVAPANQGLGLVPSLFTADPKNEYRLNTNSIAIYVLTDDNVKMKYIEATTGIKVPEKKLVLG
jgi:hypothetical protein